MASRHTTRGLLTAHSISLRTMSKSHSKEKTTAGEQSGDEVPACPPATGRELLGDRKILERLVEQDGAAGDHVLAGPDRLRTALAHRPRLAHQIDDILKATNDTNATADED